jgi:hypothetical protein
MYGRLPRTAPSLTVFGPSESHTRPDFLTAAYRVAACRSIQFVRKSYFSESVLDCFAQTCDLNSLSLFAGKTSDVGPRHSGQPDPDRWHGRTRPFRRCGNFFSRYNPR